MPSRGLNLRNCRRGSLWELRRRLLVLLLASFASHLQLEDKHTHEAGPTSGHRSERDPDVLGDIGLALGISSQGAFRRFAKRQVEMDPALAEQALAIARADRKLNEALNLGWADDRYKGERAEREAAKGNWNYSS